MSKIKYRYNPASLTYDKVELRFHHKLLRVLGFLSAVLFASFIIIVLAYTYIDSPKEKHLKREISQLELQYEILDSRLSEMDGVLAELQLRDDNIYRVIFEAEPIPGEIRKAGFGGVNKYKMLENYDNSELMVAATRNLDVITKQMYVQSKSYDEVMNLVKNKTDMLSSIPAIQPVANKDLRRMASGYGFRIDPIYKTRKMHQGMDFTANTGTEIYSTGDGKVIKVTSSRRGYGNHVMIDHGFGYVTLYGHMSKFNVRNGQKVNRGDVIGYVGNTGKSVGPHLHYEVRKNGRAINPVNFYFNDLSPDEFEEMIELSSQANQSFD